MPRKERSDASEEVCLCGDDLRRYQPVRAGTRSVRERLEQRRILALLDRLEAHAERVEWLDLPRRWARDAQELAGLVTSSVRDIREFLVGPEDGKEAQNAKRKPRAESVAPASRVSSGSPGDAGLPSNVYEFRPRTRRSSRR